MNFENMHPYVYNASRIPFNSGQASLSRICYETSLFLIGEGGGTLTIGDTAYHTGPGSLIYIPPGVKHDWVADYDDPMVHYCCYFDWTYVDRKRTFEQPHTIIYKDSEYQPEWLGPLFPLPIPLLAQVDKPWAWVKSFENFYWPNAFPNEKNYMRNLKVQHHFQAFIMDFLTFVLKEEQIPDYRISKLIDQLDQDLQNGNVKPLETYYKKLGLSRGYFSELFKQTTGTSPLQYINLYRMNKAKEDLQHSSLSITEIAEKHQFSSIHYFSKLFRRVMGKSPNQVRKGSHYG